MEQSGVQGDAAGGHMFAALTK